MKKQTKVRYAVVAILFTLIMVIRLNQPKRSVVISWGESESIFPKEIPKGGERSGGDRPQYDPGWRLDAATEALAGPEFIDCGATTLNTPTRSQVEACGVTAFKAHKPFRLIYEISGRADGRQIGVVGTAKGQVYIAANHFNSDEVSSMEEETLYACGQSDVIELNDHFMVGCKENKDFIPGGNYGGYDGAVFSYQPPNSR